MPDAGSGITISGASMAKWGGGIIAVVITASILYVARAIPEIETNLAVIASNMAAMKESDRAQWDKLMKTDEKISKVDERLTGVREYLAEKGWVKDGHR